MRAHPHLGLHLIGFVAQVKKATGIPRSFLKPVAQVGDAKSTLLLPNGSFAVMQPNSCVLRLCVWCCMCPASARSVFRDALTLPTDATLLRCKRGCPAGSIATRCAICDSRHYTRFTGPSRPPPDPRRSPVSAVSGPTARGSLDAVLQLRILRRVYGSSCAIDLFVDSLC